MVMLGRCVDEALDFALALHTDRGHEQIQIGAGIHVGAMQIEGGDVFGGTVNFAARVIGKIEGAEIWLERSGQAGYRYDRRVTPP